MKLGTEVAGLSGGDLKVAVDNGSITEQTPVVTEVGSGTLYAIHRSDTSPHFDGAFERFAVAGEKVTSVFVSLTPAERDGRKPVPATVGQSLVYRMTQGD